MDATRRTQSLRRVATTASLAALILIPAGQAEAAKKKKPKSPVITKVTPMTAKVGQTLTIKGRHFRKGKRKNSVGFKADGYSVVFVRSNLSTKKTMTVRLANKLEKVMDGATTFKLRVLSRRFGKRYTSRRLSPTIRPRPVEVDVDGNPTTPTEDTPAPTPPEEPACDPRGNDHDGDLLPNALETDTLGTSACRADTDGDGVPDGYEYRSAIDLNDDEYQQPNTTLPFPKDLPYPNPLSADADRDHDGDGLPMITEYELWDKLTDPADRTLEDVGDKATPLTYSAGLQYSVSRRCGAGETGGLCGQGNIHQNRRVPTLTGDNYDKYQNFLGWLDANGYRRIFLQDDERWFDYAGGWNEYDILDVDRSGVVDPPEAVSLDSNADGFLSDDERDEDADGLSNFDEIRGRMVVGYWTACYAAESAYEIAYVGTDPAKADTDGDGVRDGADDQDHDDVPNLMELSRMAASHLDDTDDGIELSLTGGGRPCKQDQDLEPDAPRHPDAFGKVNPFNPCFPDVNSRTCQLHPIIGSDPGPEWWSLQ